MQSQFLAAINQLCDEKGIPKDKILETIKAAIRAAYRKDYGTRDQNIEIDLTDSAEGTTVYLVKEVVKKVEEPDLQMTLAEAKKYKKNAKVGDTIKIDVTPLEYGRIAAQSAKQVIIQRIQEAERDIMYDTFKDRENELINALVHRVEGQNVYVNLDNRITTILTHDQQIPRERYYGGQRLKLYLDKVIKTTKGPQLLISRTHENLVRKLMELEIPEIKSNLVEIKGIAREPGVRSKVAVFSSDPKIDPIGSCVGQKGVRVTNVMDELNGERIDIIQWNDNPEDYIKAALAPAKVAQLAISEDIKRVKVYVQPDQ
ncbi:transcription termination factor NusA, partial [Patescibacteria group bacterium]|nr:transcription termination factor NusA [Patescibacteria group bacterium]